MSRETRGVATDTRGPHGGNIAHHRRNSRLSVKRLLACSRFALPPVLSLPSANNVPAVWRVPCKLVRYLPPQWTCSEAALQQCTLQSDKCGCKVHVRGFCTKTLAIAVAVCSIAMDSACRHCGIPEPWPWTSLQARAAAAHATKISGFGYNDYIPHNAVPARSSQHYVTTFAYQACMLSIMCADPYRG